MERTFIEQQKERLLALRQEIEHDLQQVHENIAQGLAPSEATDQEEVAVINNMRQIDMAGGDLFEDRLYEIDHALKAIKEGAYGTCERCGRPINPERLEAKPWATFCITCQAALDAGQ
jgi:DnaK suppressor protein